MIPERDSPIYRNALRYVSSLGALRSLNNVKRYPLAFFKGLVAIRLNGAEMYEYIFSAFHFDEPKSFF